MNFIGTGKRLTPADRQRAASFLGCELAAIDAVLAVEARGRGFDAKNRPVILFEPHVFYRELGSGRSRDRAARQGLAYSSWRSQPYPKSQDARYAQLAKAMRVDRSAALKSASWGLGQVMGFNHQLAGFETVEDMVETMLQGEAEQLMAMAQFVKTRGLNRWLAALQWTPFARGYNGSGYAKHGYHRKLERAYLKAKGGVVIVAPDDPLADGMLTQGEKGAPVEKLQRDLVKLGYDVGGQDGDFGPLTEQAVREFQAQYMLAIDGKAGPKTLRAVEGALKPVVVKSEPRPVTPPTQQPLPPIPPDVEPVPPAEEPASLIAKLIPLLQSLLKALRLSS